MDAEALRSKMIPAGTTIRTAARGTVRLVRPMPAPPDGWWRCWWCHAGRLVRDTVTVAEHRYATYPELADRDRYVMERQHDTEDDIRREHGIAADLELGWRSETADIATMSF